MPNVIATRAIAADPETPEAVLLTLLGHKDWGVCCAAAQNVGASDSVRFAALATGQLGLAYAVGLLADTLSPAVVDALFEHPSPYARIGLAKKTTDPHMFRKLAASPEWTVRREVAGSPACPRDLV